MRKDKIYSKSQNFLSHTRMERGQTFKDTLQRTLQLLTMLREVLKDHRRYNLLDKKSVEKVDMFGIYSSFLAYFSAFQSKHLKA